jgi:hypothetical protein
MFCVLDPGQGSTAVGNVQCKTGRKSAPPTDPEQARNLSHGKGVHLALGPTFLFSSMKAPPDLDPRGVDVGEGNKDDYKAGRG